MGPESIVIWIAVTRHVFLDETKRHGYVVAAAAVPPGDLASLAGDRVVSASPTEQDHRVARLHFETSGFAGPGPAASGDLPVSWPCLIRAAITVGASPVSLGTHPRPLVELCWRAALVGANLEHDASADRWRKAAAYKRLDPSEKSAVSYFLGMTQAKITSEMLLGVPYLVHLDAVLALLGQTTNQSRPTSWALTLPRASTRSRWRQRAAATAGRRTSPTVRSCSRRCCPRSSPPHQVRASPRWRPLTGLVIGRRTSRIHRSPTAKWQTC